MNLAALAVAAVIASPSVDASPEGRVLFHLRDPRITESSGIAAATREPGVWFTHNDSGDSARFFAIGPSGRTLGTYDVDGVSAVDWEDMAAAPRAGVPTLWFGDIGDNTASRPYVSVYAVREPGVLPGLSGARAHLTATRFRFRYPDGPRDAETLMVDPHTSRIYIASKSFDGATHVHLAPEHPTNATVNDLAELVDIQWTPHPGPGLRALASQLATTGGAFSPDGRSLVLRTYTDAYVYRLQGSGPLAVAAALAGTPQRIALPEQPQGEGICFRPDGKALVVSSEHAGSAVDEVLLPQVPPPAAAPSSGAASTSAAVASRTGSSASSRLPTSRPAASAVPSARTHEGGHGALPAVGTAAALVVAGAVALLVRRRRAGPARSRRRCGPGRRSRSRR